MIYSFLNIVCWHDVFNRHLEEKLYVDSISLRFMFWIFGFEKRIFSGVECFQALKNKNDLAYLLPHDLMPELKPQLKFILPAISGSTTEIPDELLKFLNLLISNHINKIAIGISSPKQNLVARLIADKFDNYFEIYCVGGAISLPVIANNRNLWWVFLKSSPLRTVKKLAITIFFCLLIFLKPQERKKFKQCVCFFE